MNSILRHAALVALAGLLLAATSQPSQPARVVLGYYNTDQPKCFDALTGYGARLNTVSTDSFLLGAKGSISGDVPTKAVEFAHAHQMPVFACISNDNSDPKIAHQSITTSRTASVANLLNLATTNGYTGINIDLEGVDPADRAAFSQFIHVLATTLHDHRLQLVISVPAETKDDPKESWSGAFDYAALGQDADYLQVMTYDQNVSGDDPGPVAGLDWMTDCIRYAVSKIPPAKILLGLPAYGRDWNVKTKKAKDIFWIDIPALAKSHDATISYDATTASGFFDYQAAAVKHRVWCETPQGIQLKSALVKQFNLRGVSFWALGMEDDSYRDAIDAGMR